MPASHRPARCGGHAGAARKTLLLPAFAACAALAAGACSPALKTGADAPEPALIEFTGDGGFLPKRIDIKPGTEVRFTNASSQEFWPASNIHPTHSILPELDAKRPVAPGESWPFTFQEAGFWRFHNHLAPQQGGLVVVSGGRAGPPPEALAFKMPAPFETPGDIPADDRAALLSDHSLMRNYLRRYGPEQTVRLMKEAELRTGGDCHQAAHHLGRAAYEAFGAAAFSLSSHECHAGAFHGATEALFASRGTVNLEQDVANICSAAQRPFFRHQCLHGVGHGLMAWTTYEIHDALALCDRMPTEVDRLSCYSGVFMENVVGGLSGMMGHVTEYLRNDDPHFPCNVVGDRYRAPCYFYQTSHMLNVFNRDLAKVAQACADLPWEIQSSCFDSYGRDVGGLTRTNPEAAIRHCGHAPKGMPRIRCIMGAVQDRFWEASGADAALAMCAMITDRAEQDACYETIIVRARDVLPNEEAAGGFCARVSDRWRDPCSDAILSAGGRS